MQFYAAARAYIIEINLYSKPFLRNLNIKNQFKIQNIFYEIT